MWILEGVKDADSEAPNKSNLRLFPIAAPLPQSPGIIRLAIGSNGGADPSFVPNAAILPDTARYRIDFQSYLLAALGLAQFLEAGKSGAAQLYDADAMVALQCKQSAHRWLWWPRHTVALMARNFAPKELVLERAAARAPAPGDALELGAVDELMQAFGQALATGYFERYRRTIESIHGTNPHGWPPVWNFARVVRNAMSHGGAIHFTQPMAPRVKWRKLDYSPADNGRPILHTDLWPGDLFDLLVEMDRHLP